MLRGVVLNLLQFDRPLVLDTLHVALHGLQDTLMRSLGFGDEVILLL
jgi:hypothetical protein